MVEVSCGYRVHINSIDMNGFNRRVCGGVGFCLEEPRVTVKVAEASKVHALKGDFSKELSDLLLEFLSRRNVRKFYSIEINDLILRHKGLGSYTVSKLCLLKALYELERIEFSAQEASTYAIGCTSGISINAFFEGGIIVDGGYRHLSNEKKSINGEDDRAIAAKIVSLEAPSSWRVIVGVPKKSNSLSGSEEKIFFDSITPIKNPEVFKISYHILMGLLPAVIESNFEDFISSIKYITSFGTKPYEENLNNCVSKDLLRFMRKKYNNANISSLGPSVYSFVSCEESVEKLKEEFIEFEFYMTSISNTGFRMEKENDCLLNK